MIHQKMIDSEDFTMRRKRKFDGKTLHTQTDPGTDATCVTVYDDTTIRRYDDTTIDHFLVKSGKSIIFW
jgi:hypothetical protein